MIEDCLDNLHERPNVDNDISPQDDLVEILNITGQEHRKWLMELWRRFRINQEPILTEKGELIAEPLFWLKSEDSCYACFGPQFPRQRVLQRLEDLGVQVLNIGQEIKVKTP